MRTEYCEKVKRGETDAVDFAAFLHHVSLCEDCHRRIFSRIIIKSKQWENGDNNGPK
jgi:hypothetical protein